MAFSTSDVSRTIAAQFGGCQEFHGSDDTRLHTAAYYGDTETLRELLKQMTSGEAINRRNHLGCTPLRLAATGGHTESALVLLDHGASIEVPDVKGQTPLHVAVKNLHFRCAEILLERGADPNGDANNRSTPLALAAMQGSLHLVQLLLKFRAEIVIQRKGSTGLGFTIDPLKLATAYQHYDCLKLLLSSGGKPVNTSSFTGVSSPYHIQRCGSEFAELLYEFGISPWVKDSRERYPWDTEPRGVTRESENSGGLVEFFRKIRDEPRSLKSWCRLSVWRRISSEKKCASSLECLPGVPASLIQYLTFERL
ncbi:ankyrin repeat and SOCS box protein 1-like [Littorina saxatilis]|uniref:SOCS box domain-containing protein n=1 Tax=Littorina saxatilis TaxID=31220 RepID=A0AAN9ATC9_9CAEN